MYTIEENLFKKNRCYVAGKKIKPKGVMVHSVGIKGTTFKNYKSWNNDNISKCVHAFIDIEGIYQTLPWDHRGWHARRFCQ